MFPLKTVFLKSMEESNDVQANGNVDVIFVTNQLQGSDLTFPVEDSLVRHCENLLQVLNILFFSYLKLLFNLSITCVRHLLNCSWSEKLTEAPTILFREPILPTRTKITFLYDGGR